MVISQVIKKKKKKGQIVMMTLYYPKIWQAAIVVLLLKYSCNLKDFYGLQRCQPVIDQDNGDVSRGARHTPKQ